MADDLLAEISRRRNAIEVELRRVLKNGLRYSHGVRSGHEALSCLQKERRSVLAQYGYDQMWKEMFFNELFSVLDAKWGAFQSYFSVDKKKVLDWLDHINRCRADAHARSLNDDDISFLRVCFRRIEETLNLAKG